ncbi:MAG TPA: NDP-sugar synthase [Acidimicrobiales bacterium]|nr:NDP-sugar synthase [Acidimicrobiales bacterium]
MKAVVLVGGFGTRLRPLTLSTPKQMLPVANRLMIERVVEHLGQHGVDEAILALGYRPDAFVEAYPDGRCAGVDLHYAVEPQPLDTAGAIRFAASSAGIDERFLVVNGDVLTDLDVTGLVAFHDGHGAEGTISLTRVEDPSAYGVVPTDDDGRVTAFIEKPPRHEAPTDLINAGTYVLEPSVLARIAAEGPVNVERVTFPEMVADGTLYALDGDAYWIDAGTPATYLAANLDLISGRRGTPEAAVHPTAAVAGDADGSVVGYGATVAAGAAVHRSVLLPGARVEEGATVCDSVLGPRSLVRPGAVVEAGSVLGDDVVVEAGQRVSGTKIPEG